MLNNHSGDFNYLIHQNYSANDSYPSLFIPYSAS